MDHEPKALKKIMAKEQITWRTFADSDNKIFRQWNTPPTPAFYVIDPKGTIRRKWIGLHPGKQAIDSALEKLIEETK